MAIYKITSHGGTGKSLNIYGSGQVTKHRNVCVWSDSGKSEQKWSVSALPGDTQILSLADTTYGLNIWRGSDNQFNCDVLPVEGNIYDSTVTIKTVNAASQLYTIRLKNDSLYLTAKGTADGSDVRWEPVSSSSAQQWKFELLSAGGGSTAATKAGADADFTVGPAASGTMLKGFPFVSQYSFTDGFAKTFADGACLASCYLTIANYLGKNTTMQRLVASGDVDPNSARVNRFTIIGTSGYITANAVPATVLKSEIAAGRPLILRLSPENNVSNTHFVVAYGYTGEGSSPEQVLVMDPARRMQSGTIFHGTLADAIAYQKNNRRVLTGYRVIFKK